MAHNLDRTEIDEWRSNRSDARKRMGEVVVMRHAECDHTNSMNEKISHIRYRSQVSAAHARVERIIA